jgi:hypothetical protein
MNLFLRELVAQVFLKSHVWLTDRTVDKAPHPNPLLVWRGEGDKARVAGGAGRMFQYTLVEVQGRGRNARSVLQKHVHCMLNEKAPEDWRSPRR